MVQGRVGEGDGAGTSGGKRWCKAKQGKEGLMVRGQAGEDVVDGARPSWGRRWCEAE
jgi:hypothetical protein